MIQGRQMRKARKLPRITDSTGDPSFWWRRVIVTAANAKPLRIATALPSTLARSSPPAKNRPIPASTTPIVIQSARVVRSPSIQAPSRATQIGAVYWSRIAFAAVVSLVAMHTEAVHTA